MYFVVCVSLSAISSAGCGGEPPQASGLGLRRSVTPVFPSWRLPRRGQVGGGSRVRLFSFLPRGISRHGACAGKHFLGKYRSATSVFAPARWQSRHRRAGWVCAAPLRPSSLPGDCHVATLLAMTVALRVFAWSVIRVRVSSFLSRGFLDFGYAFARNDIVFVWFYSVNCYNDVIYAQ